MTGETARQVLDSISRGDWISLWETEALDALSTVDQTGEVLIELITYRDGATDPAAREAYGKAVDLLERVLVE